MMEGGTGATSWDEVLILMEKGGNCTEEERGPLVAKKMGRKSSSMREQARKLSKVERTVRVQQKKGERGLDEGSAITNQSSFLI